MVQWNSIRFRFGVHAPRKHERQAEKNMNTPSRSILDENNSPLSVILMLAWPIFVEQVLVALVGAVDTAMVGSLGAAATAAVAINYSPNMLITSVFLALGVGFTSLIARSIGAGRLERARVLVRQSLLSVIAVGLPLSVLCYVFAREIPIWMGGEAEILNDAEIYNRILALSLLFRGLTMALTAIYRGYGDSKTPMVINILMNVLNFVGNYFLIYPTRTVHYFGLEFTMFGCGWGVAGAAIASTLAGILGGLALAVLCFSKNSPMHISIHDDFRPNWPELSAVVRVSLPVMLERIAMSGAFIVVSHAVATLGTAAVAAQNLSGTAESISFMPGFAFGEAVTTLFGQSIGAKKPRLAHKYVVHTLRISSFIMFFMSLALYFGSASIISLFTPDAEVNAMGADLLKILAVIQIPQVAAMVYSGALKGAGDTKSCFLIALISMWGVRLLGTVICVHGLGMGLNATCVCMCLDNVVRWFLFRTQYRRKGWAAA